MEYFEPKIEGDKFVFTETLIGGYLQRGSYSSHDIKSIWNNKLELLDMKIDRKSVAYFFDKNVKLRKDIKGDDLSSFQTKGDFDFSFHKRRAIRARNRHLKYLKIFLGLEKRQEPPEQENYITTGWASLTSVLKFKKLSQTKKGKPNRKELDRPKYTQYTKETLKKKQLAEEYNIKLELFMKYRNKIFEELFGGNK